MCLPLDSLWIDDGVTVRGGRRLSWLLFSFARALHLSRLVLGLLLLIYLCCFLFIVAVFIGRRGGIRGGGSGGNISCYIVREHRHELLIIKTIEAVGFRHVVHDIIRISAFFDQRRVEESNGVAYGSTVGAAADGGEVQKLINPRGLIAVLASI